MQGTVLAGRYRLAEAIGRGGTGTVYRATDERTGGTVAVKLLDDDTFNDPTTADLLRREARLAAAIASPRVVRMIDIDLHDGWPFLVMEYVAGETLQEFLRRGGALPVREALTLALEVARALDGAYAVGVVHRDLKPLNIKLVDGQVKVLDFGLARLAERSESTRTQGYSGTPQYSAPERIAGEGDIRADIYSLGVILYRMLEGRLPFTGGNSAAVLYQQVHAPVPPLSDMVPDEVRELTLRCLAKDPEDRFQTPADLIAALTASLDNAADAPTREPSITPNNAILPPVPAAAPSPTPSITMPSASSSFAWRGRSLGITVGGAVVAVVLASVALLTLHPAGGARRTTNSVAGVAATGGVTATTLAAASVTAPRLPPGATPSISLARDEVPRSVQVDAATQPLVLAFDGVAGQGMTVAVTNVTGGGGYLINVFVAAPDGTQLGAASFDTSGGPLHLPPLPSTGRYLLALTPGPSDTVSAMVALESDVTGSLTPNGGPVALSLDQPWRQARLSFDGSQGEQLQLSLKVTTAGHGDCCVQVGLVAPDGSFLPVSTSVSSGLQTLALDPLPANGHYAVVIAPDEVVTADVTVNLSSPP
jgi:serine/threonine-protein kinase